MDLDSFTTSLAILGHSVHSISLFLCFTGAQAGTCKAKLEHNFTQPPSKKLKLPANMKQMSPQTALTPLPHLRAWPGYCISLPDVGGSVGFVATQDHESSETKSEKENDE